MIESIQPFEFEGYEIRFVGTSEVPEWVAADVIRVLYPECRKENLSNYLSKVPTEWKGNKEIITPGGRQEMVTVFEPGLYALITRSNSPKAVPFQKWVYEQVLPSIRRTGSYSISKQTSRYLPTSRERLEDIRLGMDLLYELGGIDERTQLGLRDIVRDILLDERLKQPSLPSSSRAEWPVSDRARHLGYSPNRKQLMSIGKNAARLYRLAHDGDNPPKREQFVDGATREVNCYSEDDLDILDRAIALVMEEPPKLPPSKDDSGGGVDDDYVPF